MRGSSLSIWALALLCACATSYTPRGNDRDQVMAYVNRAAELVARHGQAACPMFSEPRWKSGDWYIFVTDADTERTACHPAQPELVGQDVANLRDSAGTSIGREMAAVAAGPAGRGWVEYMWPRPGRTAPEPKSAYVVGVTGQDGRRYIVGSGGYGMLR
ncbi:MAG TPA: cache domain-containing protein [Thermoanaerobaculia bacterium]|nr:cache domain-containing protein [Thermoanaerobaculia bacterium]